MMRGRGPGVRAWAAVAVLALDGGQPAARLVRVVDAASGRPLPNAEVTDLATERVRLTDGEGAVRLTPTGDGVLRVRVRQIGYRPAQQTLAVDADSATVALQRVTYLLPGVVATAPTGCGTPPDSVARLSAAVLEQLRAGAERYETFRRAYPFRVRMERRTAPLGPDGRPARIVRAVEESDDRSWGDTYRPGRVIEYDRRGNFFASILFLASLADPRFWERHCFVARPGGRLQGTPVIQLEFTPAPHVREPEWLGVALLDSATSMLRRVEFQLVGLPANGEPRRLEGYTTFRSPAPYFVIPDTTVAVWWRKQRGETWGLPDVAQALYVTELRYRRDVPPASTPIGAPR
jgi:hypothetical protein